MTDRIYFVVVLFICVTVVHAGEYCTKNNYGSIFDDTMYCATSCCGDKYNRYCCVSNTGLVVGIVLGVIGLVAVIVSVLVAVFCCCRKTRGQTGQVCQPVGVATTVPVYGVQTTAVGYGQVGYTNVAFPQQVQTTNMPGPADNSQKWQQPPPPYNTAVTS
ncbi:protein shisa-4-like isoform X3 [Mercenaria mercenaria]|uniref:protein shisa-4-like isoform X3 n=1 Tax=Mercenaria mercenaria TaxID=6596 RepID=UPI00234E9F8E|nr:protein shisa-4-like isoform X3 [Mercenaria mercenaria]